MTTFINDNLIVLDGVNRVFKGIVRGQSMEPITYFYNDKKELDGLVLEDWMYVDRPSNSKDLLHLIDEIHSGINHHGVNDFANSILHAISFALKIGETNFTLTGDSIIYQAVKAYDQGGKIEAAIDENLHLKGVI